MGQKRIFCILSNTLPAFQELGCTTGNITLILFFVLENLIFSYDFFNFKYDLYVLHYYELDSLVEILGFGIYTILLI